MVGRYQRDRSVGASFRIGMRCPVRPPAHSHCCQKVGIVCEIVVDDGQDHQLRTQPPRVCVVQPQLSDLPGVPYPEGRGGYIQMGQLSGSEFFEPNMGFVRNGHFERRYEGITDQGDVATPGGLLRADGFTVEKTQAVGPRYGPVIASVRIAHLCVGCKTKAHPRTETHGHKRVCERHRLPVVEFSHKQNPAHACDDEHGVPADHSQQKGHVPCLGCAYILHPVQIVGLCSRYSSRASATH